MTVHQFFCILHFCHTCSLCRVELVVQFPARGSTQVLLCLFPGVLWLWHFLYSVGPHPLPSLYIYTFVVSRAFMAGAASQAGDADSSRAPGLTSGLLGSLNVHRGALLLVPQWQCISSFVFYLFNSIENIFDVDSMIHCSSRKQYAIVVHFLLYRKNSCKTQQIYVVRGWSPMETWICSSLYHQSFHQGNLLLWLWSRFKICGSHQTFLYYMHYLSCLWNGF